MPTKKGKGSEEPPKKKAISKKKETPPRAKNTIDPKAIAIRLDGYSNDDIGNGERLMISHGNEMQYVKELNCWAVWDNDWYLDEQLAMNRAKRVARAMQQEAKELQRAALAMPKGKESEEYQRASQYLKHANSSSNTGKLHAMLEMASSEVGMSSHWNVFDVDPTLLNCANGIVELREGGEPVRLRPKDRDKDRCLMGTRVPYEPDAVSVLWNEYLDTFFPDKDVRRWAQKLAGASLFGRNTERLFVFGWGDTTSGKGMFMSALEIALGDYAGPFPLTVLRDNQDERPRSDLIQALPRRIVFADEASNEWKLHADQVKRITGDVLIQARAPHSPKAVERIPAFVPWLMCNHIPEIRGRDKAIDRRIVVVPFQVSIKKDDPSYKRRMLNDKWLAPAVLAWLVEGWKIYTKEGIFDTEPVDVMVEKEKLLSELSDVDMFLREACEFGSGTKYREVSNSLYEAYERWCEKNGMYGRDRMTGVQFGMALAKRGFDKKTIRLSSGGTAAGRSGLKLLDNWKM